MRRIKSLESSRFDGGDHEDEDEYVDEDTGMLAYEYNDM